VDYSFIILWVLALAAVLALIAMAVFAFLSLMKQNELARELSDIRIGMAESFKNLDKPFGDILSEGRRCNRLFSELLALKQAEMTGDFEIVEEPIAPPPPTPTAPKLKPKAGAKSAAKLAPPPQSFPKL